MIPKLNFLLRVSCCIFRTAHYLHFLRLESHYHLLKLAQVVHSLLDVPLYEGSHKGRVVLFEVVNVGEGQLQTLHVLNALHGEGASRELQVVR